MTLHFSLIDAPPAAQLVPEGHLYHESHPELNSSGIWALDTETTRFDEPSYAWKGRTRVKPFGGHELVLGSIAGAGGVWILHRQNFCDFLAALLWADEFPPHLVFHNAAFDIPVLIRACPKLGPGLIRAVDLGRVHDTKILEPLIQIAVGSATAGQKQLVVSPSLKKLALSRAGIELEKSNDVRLTFDRYLDPRTPIPDDHLRYAATDAVATYLVYRSQVSEATALAASCDSRFPVYPDAAARFGLLSETVQVKGSLAFSWLEQYPLRVDLAQAGKLRDRLEKESAHLEAALVSYKWAKRGPKTGRFKLQFKLLRKILAEFAAAQPTPLTPEFSETGLLSLNADFWSRHLPRISKEIYENPQAETWTTPQKLSVWLRYTRCRKLLSTYVYPYGSSAEHYPEYRNFGARTGRSACTRPNAQNIPKRRDGIRSLFVPRDGWVLVESDYGAAELVALAQVYQLLYGRSTLGDTLNAGIKPHDSTAARLLPDYERLPAPEQEAARQAAKAINFGLPGGLGARALCKYARSKWGYLGTDDQLWDLRARALASDPELSDYLREHLSIEQKIQIAAKNLGISVGMLAECLDACHSDGEIIWDLLRRRLLAWMNGETRWQVPTPLGFDPRTDLFKQTTATPTGRIRGRASFTQAHNTPFQGLVADAVKLALWNLYKAYYTAPPEVIFEPVASIHDSIVITCPNDPELIRLATHTLESCMLSALREVCPDIKGTVETTPGLLRWGKNTNPWGEEE